MKILCFDTETTGLIPKPKPSIVSKDFWPYIVQLAYIYIDSDTLEYKFENDYIKLNNFSYLSQESVNVHNLSKEFLIKNGSDIKIILNKFNDYLKISDVIVAHNLDFDKEILMVEFLRNKINHNFYEYRNKKKEYCTCKKTIDLCKIEKIGQSGNIYFKWPKLVELYQFLFNKSPNENLHNALFDVYYTLQCYFKIIYKIDLELDINL